MGFVVAISGGVAAGKSAVTRRFEALGVVVHDADLVARELVLPGQPALREIAERFGREVIAADGTLDRRALREIVFGAPAERRALEEILHPLVRAVLRERAAAPVGANPVRDRSATTDGAESTVAHAMRSYSGGAGYVVVAVPLLAESKGDWSWVDRVLVVDVPRTVQHARLIARDGVDDDDAKAMIDAQATREQRLAIADDVVVNDGPIGALDGAVSTLDARYRALAAARFAA